MSRALKGKTGGYRQGGGRTKGAYYKNHWFDSQFEIDVVHFLEKHRVKWQRNTKRFYFEWNGESTYYIPDLYLPKYDAFLETKGYWWDDKKEKTEYVVKLHNLRWICLMFKQEWLVDRNILLEKLASLLSLSNHCDSS